MLKIFMVEDNVQFSRQITELIAAIDKVELEFITDQGEELVSIIANNKPDICLLDIELPGISGLEVAKEIRVRYFDTDIIFITAHASHITEAIQYYATDYITKPIDQSRFVQTIERIIKKRNLIDKTIEIKLKNKETIWLKENDIIFIEAQGRKTVIHTVHGVYVSNHSLNELITSLNNQIFFKTSRSYIVNLALVKTIAPRSRTSINIFFHTSSVHAILAKSNYEEFRTKIKKLHVRR